MARARNAFEEARQQGQLWTPAMLEPAKRGAWLDYTDPTTLTISGTAITAVADKWGRISLSEYPTGQSFRQRFWGASGDLVGKNVARGSIDSSGTLTGTFTNNVGFFGSISGHPLATATVITQVSLIYSESSAANMGLLGVRAQNNEGSAWGPSYADFFSRQGNAFITGAVSGLIASLPAPQTTWYLYAQQVGVAGSGVNEVFLDEGRRSGGTSPQTGTVGTSNLAKLRALMGEAGASGSTDGWLGQCAEQVVMIGATNFDRQRVAGSLAWKYGLQARVLPGWHPFANRPPLI